jgi:hypothetical protein
MLVPKSRAEVGVTEGRGMKLGMSFRVDPLVDSDTGMELYLRSVKRSGNDTIADSLGILIIADDSLRCVRREWRLTEFDEELVDLCARAWLRMGGTLEAALRWLGEDPPPQTLSCRSSHQAVLYKTYDREVLIKRLADMPAPELSRSNE